ncbi:TIR domain-containing protein [Leptothermofonsia sichuanensis E412]|uniref:TIR domain-containing protein n=1 Tax=Leptothermofonsia sichuanensis TaxID=2917832 RepID=UPI001CA69A47|nr:TIR domain-containing protein [Leptothermofonsia sichuanensis]QZZ18992.1 TIR domain-containing protein [Leptothermofonsia sichuanensis E412]
MNRGTVSSNTSPASQIPETSPNDVFISYSRKDKEFVQQLDAAFRSLGRDPWIDWDDIQPSEDWWQAIETGIEGADTFLFVLSPDSIASQVCQQEIEHAVRHNKRLLPLVWREGFSPQQVHPALSRHNWLFFRQEEDFSQAFQRLVKTLDTDLNHVRAHTRLLVRAIEWERKACNESFLLRGTDLEEAEDWLGQSSGKDPQPTSLQQQYIAASRKFETAHQKAEMRRQRLFTTGIGVFALLAMAAAATAFTQWQLADRLSRQNRALVEKNSRLANLPSQYQGILEEQVSFLRTRINQAAWAGRSAKSLLVEIKQSEAISAPQRAALEKIARNLMEEWMQAKPEIFAPPFNLQRLEELTTGIRLEQSRLLVEWLKLNNGYHKYHKSQIDDFEIVRVSGNQMVCEAEEIEDMTLYFNGRQSPTEQGSKRQIRYVMEKVGDRWKLSETQIINPGN